jgi:hypothetical protein
MAAMYWSLQLDELKVPSLDGTQLTRNFNRLFDIE